ncbi:unnamed protein product [Knipowitschia caucasica]
MAEKKVTRSQVAEKEDDTSTLLKEVRLVNTKIDNIEEKLISKVDALGISLERTLKQELKKIKDDFDSEIGGLKSRMSQLEEKIKTHYSRPSNTFDPDVSIVLMGLSYDEDENLAAKIKEVIEEGCACDDGVTLVALERLRARGPGPGVVKVAFASAKEKVVVLRGKTNLKSQDKFKKVFIRSAKSHTERVMEENFKVLLHDLPNGSDYFVSGNGRVLRRGDRGAERAPPPLASAPAGSRGGGQARRR